MTQHYARIRFPLAPSGHYAEHWVSCTAKDITDASRLFAAFRLGYYIATSTPPGIWTITMDRPQPPTITVYDLTSDADRNALMAHIQELREKV